MYRAICICVFLAVLSMSSSGQQTTGSNYGDQMAAEIEKSLTDHHRPVRMHPPSSQQKPFQRMDRSIEQKNFGALVAKYLQRKGGPSPSGRYAIVQNRPIIDPTHRINDRDYMGWMDFGRRSAEEYEYSS